MYLHLTQLLTCWDNHISLLNLQKDQVVNKVREENAHSGGVEHGEERGEEGGSGGDDLCKHCKHSDTLVMVKLENYFITPYNMGLAP